MSVYHKPQITILLWSMEKRLRTICCQTEDNNGKDTLDGAKSEHQRETHFEYRVEERIVGSRINLIKRAYET